MYAPVRRDAGAGPWGSRRRLALPQAARAVEPGGSFQKGGAAWGAVPGTSSHAGLEQVGRDQRRLHIQNDLQALKARVTCVSRLCSAPKPRPTLSLREA